MARLDTVDVGSLCVRCFPDALPRSVPRRRGVTGGAALLVLTFATWCVPAAVVRAQTTPVPVGGPPITAVGGTPATGVPDTSPVTIAPVQAGPSTSPPPTAAPTSSSAAPPSTSTSPSTADLVGATTVPADPALMAPVGTSVPAAGSTTTVAPAASTPDQLRRQVLAALATGGAGRSAVIVIDGSTMIDLNGTDLRPPASTQKVYTAGTALVQLGPDHRFITSVRAGAVAVGSVVTGDLILVAGGDPSLTASGLTRLAADVAGTGVRSVTGRLLVDDTHFDRALFNEGWKRSFLPGEVGPLSAFLVDGNHRSDRATLADPAMANLALFRAALVKAGVTVAGGMDRGTIGAGGPVLATRRSAPLSDLIDHMVKKSDNTYAEVVLKEMGVASGAPTAAGGVAAITRQFDRFGVPRPVMADGSGLSSINRTTAEQQVAWMTKMDASAGGRGLRRSLPIACVDGTLRSRMCGTAASGKVTAKTGYIDNVATLTGYTQTARGRRVVFSILFSGVPSSAKARAAIDRAMAAVTAYTG